VSVPFHDHGVEAAAEPDASPGSGARLRTGQLLRNLGILEQAPAFFALPDHALRRLARRLRPVDLGPGATLIEQGARGDSLYLIERGTCLLAAETERDGRVRVASLREGDLCGGSALLGEPSAVSVVTVTDCRLLALDLTSLRSVVPVGGPVEVELRQQFARRQTGYTAMAARVQRDAEAPSGEAVLIAVYSPRGGVGRTTIALNLAAQLAQGHAGEVLLVDLDLPYAPAALLSGLVPTGSVVRASWTASLGTLADLRDALLAAAQLHQTGFLLLSGALRLAESELVTTEQVTTAIRAVRGAFRHVVVDLGSSLSETTLSVVDVARHVVLVIAPELPSLKGARDVLGLFRDLNLPDDRVTVVLNHRQAGAVVSRESVTRTLGVVPAVEIGHDGSRPERAAMAGTMLVTSDPKSQVGRGVRRLAGLLRAPDDHQEPAR
jgi:pilus assembly protein CpaE